MPRLHVVLLEPEIAANTGSIGRTCVAAGAMLWLVRPLGFHLDDRHLRRAGLDYWEHLNTGSSTAWTRSSPRWAATGSGRSAPGRRGSTPTRLPARRRAWSSAPRAAACPRRWLDERPDRAVRIPIRPEARSLNLANAVAIGRLRSGPADRRPGPRSRRPGSPNEGHRTTCRDGGIDPERPGILRQTRRCQPRGSRRV